MDTMMQPETPTPTQPTPSDRSEGMDKLATALAKAQSEIEGAVKDKNNPAFRSKYADLGAVWDAVREPLTKNGLSVVQFPRRTATGVAVKTILLHASGQWISGEMEVPCSKPDAHGVGSATTYARRFSLSAVVGVAPMDDDGNGAAGKGGFGSNAKDFEGEARGDGLMNNAPMVTNAKRQAAEKWVDNTIQTLNLSAHTAESLCKFWSDNSEKIDALEEKLPKLYDRLLGAYDNAMESVKAKV